MCYPVLAGLYENISAPDGKRVFNSRAGGLVTLPFVGANCGNSTYLGTSCAYNHR